MTVQDTSAVRGRGLMALAALGVVFGDIGTSPLYALRECFHGPHAVSLTDANVMGVLSMIVWSLLLVITGKYVLYLLRADDQGEGGILALLSLALRGGGSPRVQRLIFLLGIFGAALLYGDGVITPAISVLSAVEGLRVEIPALSDYVVPITVLILFGLFGMQSHGTARVGRLFGPVMLSWFAVLTTLGVVQILKHPSVLWALSPTHAVQYFVDNGLSGLIVLGGVVLVVTGGEALYADMGHFGIRPIRTVWLVLVLPALVIHYFGQGALLLDHPEAIEHLVLYMSPAWARIPVIALSTVAAVIASQALITGVYSISRQATLLGYAPRLALVHTSEQQIGQVYMPSINTAMMIATITLVVAFQSSAGLAAAYGLAVTLTMTISTMLAFVVSRRRWGWPLVAALGVTVPLLALDAAFLGANILKFWDGGWVPIVVAALVFTAMTTWRRGRELLRERIRERSIPFDGLGAWVRGRDAVVIPDTTAVYLTAHPDSVPLALVHNVRHNHAIHARVILLSVVVEQTARVSVAKRLTVEELGEGLLRIIGHYGFTESPNVPRLLSLALAEGVDIDPETVTFIVGRETLLSARRAGMAGWRESLFSAMSRNAQRAAAFFGIPSDRVLEIGAQIEL